ncbi:hypothetical protein ME3_00414 [Bartonella melophagi K-2C]|uniref:Uncharacterized protein n=1 Tax=Bartonella melophagi K-2C TaxID=1094557 RepID=J0ZRL8_9HYPH|nr:hypothetical protein ME3_00414 [Bartonella melophagi K-2C]
MLELEPKDFLVIFTFIMGFIIVFQEGFYYHY